MEVKETVIQIIAEQALLDPADIALDSTLEELAIDSLGLVESIFAIEERFDITVPCNSNAPCSCGFDISSVATIITAVEHLIAEQTS